MLNKVRTDSLLAGLACIALTVTVFWQALFADFVNLDDNSNLKKNPAMHNVALAWEKPYLDAYLPVVYSVWRGIYGIAQSDRIQGNSIDNWSPITELDPLPFHATNIALHALNGILLFAILCELFSTASRLLLVGISAIFVFHPLQTESVAWVTALKDVLSGTFTLAAILVYVQKPLSTSIGSKNIRTNTRQLIWLSVLFLLACLSKSTRIFLPLWLMWLGHLHWKKNLSRTASELMPLFFIAAIVMLIALATQPNPKIMNYQSLWHRPWVAADALLFYSFKLLWPLNLAIDYGRNPQFLFESGQVYWSSTITCIVCVAIWKWQYHLHRWLLLGLCGFVLSLLPLLGFKPFVFQTISTVSDRYCYLSIALLLIGTTPLLLNLHKQKIIISGVLALATLLAVCTWLQVPVWRNSATLWQHTLRITPDSGIAHNNLASIHEEQGRLPEAIYHYELSTARLPLAQTFARIAILYTDQKKWIKAQEWNEKGLAIEPSNQLMLNNRSFIQSHLQRQGFRVNQSH